MPTCRSVVVPAPTPRATPVRASDSALLHVLEAYIETLKAENEILKRRLAACPTPGNLAHLFAAFRPSTAGQDRRHPPAVGRDKPKITPALETEVFGRRLSAAFERKRQTNPQYCCRRPYS